MDDRSKRSRRLIGASPDEQPIRRARRPTSKEEDDVAAARHRASLFGAPDTSAYPDPSTRAMRLIGASPEERPIRRARRTMSEDEDDVSASKRRAALFGAPDTSAYPDPSTRAMRLIGASPDDWWSGSRGSRGAAGVYKGPIIDVHSHVWPDTASTTSDYGSELLTFMAASDVSIEVMWVSGHTSAEAPNFTPLVDGIAKKMWRASTDPTKFRLFTRGFDYEAPYSASYVDTQLSIGGFKGVGELMVHAHGLDFEYTRGCVLARIFDVAASHGAPVLVHWDINGIEPVSITTTAADRRARNYNQLVQALKAHKGTNFILAHCGSGPPGNRIDDDDFCEVLMDLLDEYGNLYLDLAGMWVELSSDLGKALASVIDRHSDRFLIGVDTCPTVDTKGSGWDPMLDPDGSTTTPARSASASVVIYRNFLYSLYSATTADPADVAYNNAVGLIP